MHTLEPDKTPNSGVESLADLHPKRLRISGLSQKELASLKAGIHLQSLGKMERGRTAKPNRKLKKWTSFYALGVPAEHTGVVGKGVSVDAPAALNFASLLDTRNHPESDVGSISSSEILLLYGAELRKPDVLAQ